MCSGFESAVCVDVESEDVVVPLGGLFGVSAEESYVVDGSDGEVVAHGFLIGLYATCGRFLVVGSVGNQPPFSQFEARVASFASFFGNSAWAVGV